MRARLAVLISGVTVELREILLRDKPQEFLQTSVSATVPCLKTPDSAVLDESLDIMLWALDKNDPESWLEPQLGSLQEMLDLINWIDGDFKHHLDRYKYSNRYPVSENEAVIDHRAEALSCLKTLEERLERHPFLFGGHFTLADAAIAPFVRQFANTDRDWFDQQLIPNIHKWLFDFMESTLFTKIMGKRAPWVPGTNGILFSADHPLAA